MAFVKVSPFRHIIRFESSRKLASRFIGPFSIIEKVGKLAFRAELSKKLVGVRTIFHVSHFLKCLQGSATMAELSQFKDDEVERII